MLCHLELFREGAMICQTTVFTLKQFHILLLLIAPIFVDNALESNMMYTTYVKSYPEIMKVILSSEKVRRMICQSCFQSNVIP